MYVPFRGDNKIDGNEYWFRQVYHSWKNELDQTGCTDITLGFAVFYNISAGNSTELKVPIHTITCL